MFDDTKKNNLTIFYFSVRSFGTEDRPTDRPVPARDEIFEYIIFRGADIEDLQVREPPQTALTQDPAIVEVNHFISSSLLIVFFVFLRFSHQYIHPMLVRLQQQHPQQMPILEQIKHVHRLIKAHFQQH